MSADLDAIQARVDAATEGPWEVDAMDAGHSRFEMNVWITAGDAGDSVCDMDGLSRSRNEKVALDDGYKDATFIAHARTDVPALLALVREQAAKLDAVEALAEGWRYKGEFGWGAWQEGHGPDQEGLTLDHAAAAIRAALEPTS